MIIVVKRPAKLTEDGAGVGQGIEARIVGLEGAHEGLRHAVGFGTRDWREAHDQVELGNGTARVFRPIGRAIVREPLDGRWRTQTTKAFLDRLKRQFTDLRPIDPDTDDSPPSRPTNYEGCDTGGYSVSDLTEVFAASRATVYRTLGRTESVIKAERRRVSQ